MLRRGITDFRAKTGQAVLMQARPRGAC